ncbi:MAG: hydrogenase maturation nickel metallochaperone HypA [Clostridiales Family XIII bacterium]|jgi:hydrogenase nickel incorporation protein HypA/HybF|nr:hydrogenase maturation nickel metallochaperone HypA [Clostridiales Family XIII bacterium]
MHELSVILEIISVVETYAEENRLAGKIETLVLRIGDRSSVLPKYIEAIYPTVVRNTILSNARLEIETAPGKDFFIKEIAVTDEPE